MLRNDLCALRPPPIARCPDTRRAGRRSPQAVGHAAALRSPGAGGVYFWGSPMRWTPALREQFRRAWLEGATRAELCERFGTGLGHVSRLRQQLKLPLPRDVA